MSGYTSEKLCKHQYKVGDYAIGENRVCYAMGKIVKIEPSTGARHGLLYEIENLIGCDSRFFHDSLKPWYEGEIINRIGIKTLYTLKKPISTTISRVKCNILAFYAFDETHCAVITDKEIKYRTYHLCDNVRGIDFDFLRSNQIESIYRKEFE